MPRPPNRSAFHLLKALSGALCLILAQPGAAAPADSLRAGAARIDITPAEPVVMAGYASRTNVSLGVHDPLSARAVVFAEGDHKLALVSVESLGFYNDTAGPLRKAILDACKLQPSELFLCAIHTHSAPTLTLDPEKGHPHNVAYTRWLQGKLAEVVSQALDRLGPAQIGLGSGSSPVGVNRREPAHDRTGKAVVVLGRNPWAMTDREVQVLKVARAEGGEPLAVVFDYPVHSTSLGPRNYLISGDIHGLAAQFLENFLGNGIVTPEFAGASGNIDPWVRILPDFRTTNGWIPEPILQGTMLGEEVGRVLDTTTNLVLTSPLRTAQKILELPAKRPSGTPTQDAANSKTFIITVARLGDLAFVGLGGEVFNEFGKQIKTESPFRTTLVMTHCNDAAGYVPTRPSYEEGGYEVQSSSFAAGGGERITEEALKLLRELKEAKE